MKCVRRQVRTSAPIIVRTIMARRFVCPRYSFHVRASILGTHNLRIFSKIYIFLIFEFWPSFWVMGLFPIFLYHFLVFLRKNRIFAPMTSLFDLGSSYLATMSRSRMFKSSFFNIWIFKEKSKMAAIFLSKMTKNAIKTLFL